MKTGLFLAIAMRHKIVAGNWKMHGSRAENAALIEAIIGSVTDDRVTCVICPPFVYLHDAWRLLRSSAVALGAQDVCAEAVGAYTGEVSATMLQDVGCRYTLVGHSERRSMYGDTNALVARKFVAALGRELIPILCVGEQLSEREAGHTREVVGAQLDAILQLSGVRSLAGAVIAYEPVWAIGTGRTAAPEQAQEVHNFIRQRVAQEDAKIAAGLRVLYGGSVKAGNARDIFAMPDVDGGLIGGASLKAEEFLAIVAAAQIPQKG
jgi:triosephosphate isomerase (TIM)